MRRVFAILSTSMALVASNAAAQSIATGLAGAGNQDANWTVSWTSGPSRSTMGSASPFAAWVVPAVGGVWQPNMGVGGTNWISAWPGASSADGVGDFNEVTDAGDRYIYTYSYSFNALGAGALDFSAGWDNMFQAFVLNGQSYTPSQILASVTDNSVDGHFGFCRSGDGIFDTGDYPNCTANFSVGGVQQGSNTIEFILRGDGTTDGLWMNGGVDLQVPSLPQEATPEPATMAMLATGLIGISTAGLRRRKK